MTTQDTLTIAGRAYSSRLLVGTGKYKDFDQTRAALDASGTEIVTVAIRRTNIGQNPGEDVYKRQSSIGAVAPEFATARSVALGKRCLTQASSAPPVKYAMVTPGRFRSSTDLAAATLALDARPNICLLYTSRCV